jgi:DNA repair exonuclease SbcCD ATPase subunit
VKIKTLHLIAFGKFKDKTIELDDGLNLIYGPNEAGKSTIQAFIEGMLFGFYKPYRKRRTYRETFEQYKPLYSEQYRGALVYVDEMGREIRIERDFLKNRDGVQMFDNVTGEDITSTFPYDSVTKQYLPLGYQTINSSIYNNTVNFRQMALKTNADLAKEINDRMIDLANDDRDVSVNHIIEYLDQKKKNIGTFRATKSNYGMAVRHRSEIEDELERSEDIYGKLRLNQKKILDLHQELAEQKTKYKEIQQEEEQQKTKALEAQKVKLKQIKKDGEALEKKLVSYEEKTKQYNVSTYNTLLLLEEDRKQSEAQIKEIQQDIQKLQPEIEKNEKESERLKTRLRRFNALQVTKDLDDLKQIQEQYSRTEKRSERYDRLFQGADSRRASIKLWICMAVGLFMVLFSAVNPGPLLQGLRIVLMIVGAVLAVFGSWMYFSRRCRIQNWKHAPVSFDPEDQMAVHLSILMERYDETQSLDALRQKMTEVLKNFDHLSEADQKLANLEMQKKSLEQQIQTHQDKIEKDKAESTKILKPLGLSRLEDYQSGLDYERQVLDIKAKISANQKLYEDLNGENFVRISDQSDLFEERKQKKRSVNKKIEAIQRETSRLEGENKSLSDSVKSPVELREKRDALNQQIREYEDEIRACDMAESFFVQYSKRSHAHQAGSLNERIGKILMKITHKYSEVRVDDQLNIKVVDPMTSNLLNLDQLSGGTIDQIYFALRFGLRGIVDRQQIMPFILDDPFVQYDDQRRKDGVVFLSKVAENDQVILLTCSQNEKMTLDQKGISYTGISLER